MVESVHSYLSKPPLTPDNRIFYALNILTFAIKQAPTTRYNSQLHIIDELRELLKNGAPQRRPSQTQHHSLYPAKSQHQVCQLPNNSALSNHQPAPYPYQL